MKSRVVRTSSAVAIAGLVGLGAVGCSTSTQPGVAETPTQTQPAAAASQTSGATGQTLLKPVPIGKPAAYGNGVTATVNSATRVTLKAEGIGEVAGPGVRAEVTMKNGTSSPISLDGAAVNLMYGTDKVPASPATSSDKPFTGTLAPGQSRTATYFFAVPTSAGAIEIQVSYVADQPVAVFVGSVRT